MYDNIFMAEGDPSDWKEAIKMTSGILYDEGCVYEGFYEKCVERELKYPTGLRTKIPVAIPHTEAVNVKKTAICLMRLKKPVTFKCMEDETKEVDVDFILNLAVNDSGIHIQTLQATIALFQDDAFCAEARQCGLDVIRKKFEKAWNVIEAEGTYV